MADIDAIEPGGGVGRVIVFIAGDNCVVLVLQMNRERTERLDTRPDPFSNSNQTQTKCREWKHVYKME